MENLDLEDSACAIEFENNNVPSSLLLDEFTKICGPKEHETNSVDCKKKESMRNILKYAISLKSHSETNLSSRLNVGDQKESLKLNKITSMQNMSSVACREPTVAELTKDLDILNEAIHALSNVIDGEPIDYDKTNAETLAFLEKKLDKHQKLLDELIQRTFQNRSEEVIDFFGELLKIYFTNDNGYMSVDGREGSTDIMESLLEYGIIETHPEDNKKIKLKNNF